MNEVPDEMSCRIVELLPAYAAGSLPEVDRDRVSAHLVSCARCRADLAAWQAVAVAVSPEVDGAPDREGPPPDPAQLVRLVLTRSALDPGGSEPGPGEPGPGGSRSWPARHLRYLAALILAEARLIRLAVPVASALVMALGVVVVLAGAAAGSAASGPFTSIAAGDLLTLIAPIVAAVGVAGAHRSRHDPAAELVAAAPTSGRLLLLARLTLVFGYDLALALSASAVLAVTVSSEIAIAGMTGSAAGLDVLVGLILTWLGPMALLSSLGLLVAVRFGPDVALGTVLVLWVLRVMADGGLLRDGWAARLILDAWTTNAAVLAVSVAFGVAAVAATGDSGPFAREPRTGWRATHPT